MSLMSLVSAHVGIESDKRDQTTAAVSTQDSELTLSRLEVAEANEHLMEAERLTILQETAEVQIEMLQGISDDITEICSDGFTKRELALLNNSIRRYNKSTNPAFHVNFPGIESHSQGNRVSLSQVGAERATERAKALAKWISELLVKAIEEVQKFADKFFGGAERLKKAAEDLAKKADDFTQEDPKKKINVNTKHLSVGSTLPTNGNFVKNLGDFAEKAKLIDSEHELEKKAFEAALKAAEMSDAGKIIEDMGSSGGYGKAADNVANTNTSVTKDEVMGGKFIEVRDGRRVVSSSDTKVSKESVEIELISASDVVKGAEAIVEACDVVIGAKRLYGANKKVRDDAVKAAESLDKVIGDSETTSEQKSGLRLLARNLANHSRRVINGIHTTWANHTVTVLQSAQGVLTRSLV